MAGWDVEMGPLYVSSCTTYNAEGYHVMMLACDDAVYDSCVVPASRKRLVVQPRFGRQGGRAEGSGPEAEPGGCEESRVEGEKKRQERQDGGSLPTTL